MYTGFGHDRIQADVVCLRVYRIDTRQLETNADGQWPRPWSHPPRLCERGQRTVKKTATVAQSIALWIKGIDRDQ